MPEVSFDKYAAFDIGSNSIKLKIAGVVVDDGRLRLRPVDSKRTVTRLGDGVYQRRNRISASSMKATLNALEEMAELCEKHKIASVRAVATSAVRDASNAADFAAEVRRIIGVPVEIIPGPREADLVHLGVHTTWPELHAHKTLTLDLGGGSGQLICGRSKRIIARVSRPIGALRLARKFLRHDPPLRGERRRMEEYVEDKVSGIADQLRTDHVPYVIGTASTAAALVCHLRFIEREHRDTADGQLVTLAEVTKFYEKLLAMDLGRRRKLIGIGRRRAEILLPGVAVIERIMTACHLDELKYSTASVADRIIAHFALDKGHGHGSKQELHNVFLSYNSEDKPAVRDIARQLEDQGIVPFFDERDLRPGKLWRNEVSRVIKNIPAAAVFIGPHGVSDSQSHEINVLLDTAAVNHQRIVPVLLRGATVGQIPDRLRDLAKVNFNIEESKPLQLLVTGVEPPE